MITRLPYTLIIACVLSCSALYSKEQAQATGERATRIDRQMFISIPPFLKPLKREPVEFHHDKHAAALKKAARFAIPPRTAG